jgi:hypothetical protein
MKAWLATAKAKRTALLGLIILIGVLLHAWAVWQLPVDYDEPVYIQAAGDYAALIKAGNWQGVIDYQENSEHPPLIKLLYSLPQVLSKTPLNPSVMLFSGRTISALFGSLAVWLLALLNPLAGILLAFHTMTVKYTSQAYLEALPMCTAIAGILALVKMKAPRDKWFWFSALALGLTAAGKFSYAPIGVVVLYLLIWEKKNKVGDILLYLAAAVATFFILDPALWHDPLGRLAQALTFHEQYAQSTHVAAANYPWYQPLVWISNSVEWHPLVFFWGLDEVAFLFGLVGMYWELRERRWVAVWFLSGLLFLLFWPTKWPQYTLLIIPPLCISASTAMVRIWKKIRELDLYWDWLQMMLVKPPKWLVIGAAAFIILLVGGKLGYEIQMAVLRKGWSVVDMNSSPLPSNAIYDIKLDENGRVVLATGGGVAFWQPPKPDDLAGNWQVFTPQNSPLPGGLVKSILRDPGDGWWFGTISGLAHFDGDNWRVIRGSDIGLAGESIQALVYDGSGRLWVGTTSGLAAFDGQSWQTFTTASSGILDDAILSLAYQPTAESGILWIGALKGISRLDISSGEWRNFSGDDPNIGWAGISNLLIDSHGKVWAASLGGGISIWDGQAWSSYRVSNSGLPSNTVQRISELQPGEFWIGTSLPAEAGGVLVHYDLTTWNTYTPSHSGFPGAEPIAFALDGQGLLLIGTRTAGLVIYQEKK